MASVSERRTVAAPCTGSLILELGPASSRALVFGSMVACELASVLLRKHRTDSPAPVFEPVSDPSLVSGMIDACKPPLAFGPIHRTDLLVLVLEPAFDSTCSTCLLYTSDAADE